ncbi:RRM domain-containing protein [Mycena indigotica]|uniref:RRM domain-containing protein n=1 Tax=Mycena indigotica TaxID=2126181 RepID=A0A8H6WFE2_9AGAR|nr:RRM domain-containing protein [Mycena indigotica]KAF7315707.1 RRM domain-containing protein [Mycena indigotica]
MSNVAKAAESTLYHLSPKGFWKKFRAVAAVNSEISTGLPLPSIHRFPPPASRPEKYSTPATKASDPAQNPYWKRDVRRAYPQLSVVTQSELSALLIEHSAAQAVAAPSSEKKDVPAEPPAAVDLSVAISSITQSRKLYTPTSLPPTLPTSRTLWTPQVTVEAVDVVVTNIHLMSAPPSYAAGLSAAALAEAFGKDERIYLERTTNTWRYEEADGTEMEYDAAKGKWLPLVDEDLLKRQQAAYSVSGVDEETPAAPVLARENKKRKEPEDYTSATPQAGPSTKRGKKETERKSKNTAVYVTGLPVDADLEEIVDRFSKCGVLEEDDDGEPKVKMYAQDDGSFSGEALVVYFKEDSVFLAERMLDDAELRIGDPSTVMRVAKADFTHKTTGGNGQGGESKPRKTVDKKKTSRRIVKMQKHAKLAEWDEEDGFGPSLDDDELAAAAAAKNSRVVVLKHMFTLKALEEDASLLLDLKEDVREECSTLGEVTNVVLYDKEPDGIMTVKFRDPLGAQACVVKMNGRFFDGLRVEASLYSGKQRFKRSGAGDEGDGDERERLDSFAAWLLSEND